MWKAAVPLARMVEKNKKKKINITTETFHSWLGFSLLGWECQLNSDFNKCAETVQWAKLNEGRLCRRAISLINTQLFLINFVKPDIVMPLALHDNKAIVALTASGETVKQNWESKQNSCGLCCEQPFQSVMHLDGNTARQRHFCFVHGIVALKAIGVTYSATAWEWKVQLRPIEERNYLICWVKHDNCNRIIFDWHFYERNATSQAICCPCFSCTERFSVERRGPTTPQHLLVSPLLRPLLEPCLSSWSFFVKVLLTPTCMKISEAVCQLWLEV